MQNEKRRLVVLTGGGTAGHVMPHLAILPELRAAGFDFYYIGADGIEKNLIHQAGVTYRQITAGKLRRYFSWRNFSDIFWVFWGLLQSLAILLQRRPAVIFSKGGFVSVPVALAGWLLRIPVVSHESDLSPGLANRIISKFASLILYSFPETKIHLAGVESCYVGLPIRQELMSGDKEAGFKLCGFAACKEKYTILIMGGSLGAQRLNQIIIGVLPTLVEKHFVVHITGKGKRAEFNHPNYCQFEYVDSELRHIFAITDFVISRAGANSIFEFLELAIPMLLVPLEIGSRGDQVENAHCFVEKKWALMLRESEMDDAKLLASIQLMQDSADQIVTAQRASGLIKARMRVVEILAMIAKGSPPKT